MSKIVSGNWKMNGSKADLDNWFKSFFEAAKNYESSRKLTNDEIPTIILCVPSIFIEYAQNQAEKYNKETNFIKVNIGAEDCHYENSGAFTGNTSPVFVKEFGCKYTLVGHSERREFQKETSEIVAKKAIAALNNGLTPLVCIGESLSDREAGTHFKFIGEQVIASTEGVELERVIIAYEPVWSIGTGKVPSETDINEMETYIKDVLADVRKIDRQKIKVVYGGSVKSSNSGSIMNLSEVDGVLVGGASLKGDEFFKIAESSIK